MGGADNRLLVSPLPLFKNAMSVILTMLRFGDASVRNMTSMNISIWDR